LTKRLTENQKVQILKEFLEGKTINEISEELNFTKLTITRNLKKNLGENEFKNLINQKKISVKKNLSIKIKENKELHKEFLCETKNKDNVDEITNKVKKLDPNSAYSGEFVPDQFVEISPLDYEIDNTPRKEVSSIPISEIEFPKIAYMIVDKKIELETKSLNDFPEWQFLPSNDLNRKTIEIFEDLKLAKRRCSKDQKVLKVPNTNVFNIVAPILISRGITRIIIAEKLISL